MTSELLQKARNYEAEKRPGVQEQLPAYHLTGGVGWINDPNGFSVYQGQYHLFFQYYPFDVHWGTMHWGHARSRDLIRWEFLPAAMAPDAPYDRDGCFSGSAAELPDGRQLLVYTGVRKDTLPDGSVRELQTQCLAFGDGVDYEKAPENPCITAADLPEGGSARHFRDPKIWREGDRWCLAVANLDGEKNGRILLYESCDLIHWTRRGVLAEGRGELGTMWECPDFFRLDGKAVLIHSAHEMQARGLEFHPGDGTVCHIGRYDPDQGCLHTETIQAVDYGLDFYAPQSLETPDGRRVMVGWMQSWVAANCRPESLGFFGQMTVPRELRIRNGRLIQWPVRELEKYRKRAVSYRDVFIDGEQELPGISGRVLDLNLCLRPERDCRRFRLRFAVGEGLYTEILLLPEEGILRLDRRHSGFPHDVVHLRELPVELKEGEIPMRLLLDRYSAELFCNGGEQAASMTLYTPLSAEGISFAAEGGAHLDVEKYELEWE